MSCKVILIVVQSDRQGVRAGCYHTCRKCSLEEFEVCACRSSMAY
jgi:hypothetical protein